MKSALLITAALISLVWLGGCTPETPPASENTSANLTAPDYWEFHQRALDMERHPKIGPILDRLILAEEYGFTAEYAKQNLIEDSVDVDNGLVRVTVQPTDGRTEEAVEAVREYGEVLDRVWTLGIAARVPISKVKALAEHPAIKMIRMPIMATPAN
ncbi:hypothetical protein ACFLYX_01075 [Chloroflexota bacterium]